MIGVAAIGACDRSHDSRPAPAAPAPEPSPAPQPTPTSTESAAPSAESPTLAVAQTVPAGIVVDHWTLGGRCTIDSINLVPQSTKPVDVKLGAPVKISGWAYDKAGTRLPDAVHVRFASRSGAYYWGTASIGARRDDVRKVEHLPDAMTGTGFELSFDSNLLPPGEYALVLLLRSGDNTYLCDNGRKLNVTP
jgi:hypothetical protein